MIVRGRNQNIAGRHAGLRFDSVANQIDENIIGPDQVERHDGHLRFTVVQDQHTGTQRIAHSRHQPSMSGDLEFAHLARSDIDLGDAGPQVRFDRKATCLIHGEYPRAAQHAENSQNAECEVLCTSHCGFSIWLSAPSSWIRCAIADVSDANVSHIWI